jgi:tetratricopeptide (TPR) repeat protein
MKILIQVYLAKYPERVLDISSQQSWISLLQMGKYDEAIEDLNKAIELDSKFIKAYNNRGWSFKKKATTIQRLKITIKH